MLRVRGRLASDWSWAAAVETPGPQFAVPSSLTGGARSNMPDIPGYVRYEQPREYVQIAGVLRQLRFDAGEGLTNEGTIGGGVNATFSVAAIGDDVVQGQFVIGSGTARYIESLSGQNHGRRGGRYVQPLERLDLRRGSRRPLSIPSDHDMDGRARIAAERHAEKEAIL